MKEIGKEENRSPGVSESSENRQLARPMFHNPFMAAYQAKEVLARLVSKEK